PAPEGKEDATEAVPVDEEATAAMQEALSGVAVDAGIEFEDFKRIARERFVPNGLISSTARELVEKKAIPQTGTVRELSPQHLLILLDACLAKSGGGKS